MSPQAVSSFSSSSAPSTSLVVHLHRSPPTTHASSPSLPTASASSFTSAAAPSGSRAIDPTSFYDATSTATVGPASRSFSTPHPVSWDLSAVAERQSSHFSLDRVGGDGAFIRPQPTRPKALRPRFPKWEEPEDSLLLLVCRDNAALHANVVVSPGSPPMLLDKQGAACNWSEVTEEMHRRIASANHADRVHKRTESAYKARVKVLLTPINPPFNPKEFGAVPPRLSGRERKQTKPVELFWADLSKNGSKKARLAADTAAAAHADGPSGLSRSMMSDDSQSSSKDDYYDHSSQSPHYMDGNSEDGDGEDGIATNYRIKHSRCGDGGRGPHEAKQEGGFREYEESAEDDAGGGGNDDDNDRSRAVGTGRQKDMRSADGMANLKGEDEEGERIEEEDVKEELDSHQVWAKRVEQTNVKRMERHRRLKEANAAQFQIKLLAGGPKVRHYSYASEESSDEEEEEDDIIDENDKPYGKPPRLASNINGTNWAHLEDVSLYELKTRDGGALSWAQVMNEFAFDRSLGAVQSRWNNILKPKAVLAADILPGRPGKRGRAASPAPISAIPVLPFASSSSSSVFPAVIPSAFARAAGQLPACAPSVSAASLNRQAMRSQSPVPRKSRNDASEKSDAVRPGYYYQDKQTGARSSYAQASRQANARLTSPPPQYPVSRTYFSDSPARPVYVVRRDQFGNVVESNRPIEPDQAIPRRHHKPLRSFHTTSTLTSSCSASYPHSSSNEPIRTSRARGTFPTRRRGLVHQAAQKDKLSRFFRAASI